MSGKWIEEKESRRVRVCVVYVMHNMSPGGLARGEGGGNRGGGKGSEGEGRLGKVCRWVEVMTAGFREW